MIACLLALLCVGADPLLADQTVIDRGQVRVGPPLTQTYRLTNRAQQPLTITGIQSTCGCMAPKVDRTTLAPGENATLTVEVNTLSQPAGSVAWITNVGWRTESASGDLSLTLKANLVAEVRVEPAAVAFQVRQTRSVDVTVTDTRPRPFRITKVGSTISQVKAEVVPSSDRTSQRIRVTASPDGPSGVQSAVVWFTTDDPLYPQIRVPITLQVPAKTRVTASPSVLLMERGSGRILLRDSEDQPIQIDRIEIEGPLKVTDNGALLVVYSDRKRWDGTPATGKLIVHLRKPIVETISIVVDIR